MRRNFQQWTMNHNARAADPFNEAQMAWLQMIRDHIITSFCIEADDFELSPFNQHGGLGEAYDILCANGEDFDELLNEINEALVA